MTTTLLRSLAIILVLVVCPWAPAAERATNSLYENLLHSTALIQVQGRQGTGWLADASRRLLITNHHVVGHSGQVTVVFPEYKDGKLIAEARYYRENLPLLAKKGRAVKGFIVASDPVHDLSVVRLEMVPEDMTALPLSREGVSPSERIHSVGNPGASDAFWVYTTGTVRQVYRNRFQYEDGQQVDAQVIETQAPLNPGDSGGPVVNDRGELVGVNAAGKSGAQLVSLCIDVREVRALLGSDTVTEAASRRHARSVNDLPRNPRPEDHNNRGVDFHTQGDFSRALFEYTQALQQDPEYALAYRNRGLTFLTMAAQGGRGARGFLKQALVDYSIALQIQPRDAEALRERGLVHGRLGDLDRAIADFNKALEVRGDYPEALKDRSKAYRQKGELAKAEADLDRALRLARK